MGKVISDCWQSVIKLSSLTEIFCQQSETSRLDAIILGHPYTISFTDCPYSVGKVLVKCLIPCLLYEHKFSSYNQRVPIA